MATDYSNYNARSTGEYDRIWLNTGKCVFCDLKDKYIVKKSKYSVLTVNLFPYTDGQLLIIPIRHVEDFLELSKEEWDDMYELSNLAIKLIRKVYKHEEIWLNLKAPGGFAASKTVAHLHLNLIPYSKSLVEINPREIEISPLQQAKEYREVIDRI